MNALMEAISSPENKKYRQWLSLAQAQGQKKNGLFIVSGQKILNELASSDFKIQTWLCLKDDLDTFLSSALYKKAKQTLFILTPPLFKELNFLNTQGPLAVVQKPALKEYSASYPLTESELFLDLQDPSNVGAALRVAEAFYVKKVVLLKNCADPFLPKSCRAASGSLFRLQLSRCSQLETMIKSAGKSFFSTCYALDKSGTPLQQMKWPKAFRLFLGQEGQGLDPLIEGHKKIKKISIPINENVESLSAVSALSVCLFKTSEKTS